MKRNYQGNYQVTWFGQVISKVVSTQYDAELIRDREIEIYRNQFQQGWVTYFDPTAVQIQSTTKKIGEY